MGNSSFSLIEKGHEKFGAGVCADQAMAGSSSEDESSRKRGAVLNSSAASLFVCSIKSKSEMRSPRRWLLHNKALCRSGRLVSNPPAKLLSIYFEIFV